MYATAFTPRLGKRALLVALVAVIAGCSQDSGLNPALQPAAGPPVHPIASIVAAQSSPDSVDVTFTVPTTGGVFQVGKHIIYFGANSICNPETSTYGPTEWDAPCEAATEPITITAAVRWHSGRAWVQFSPSLRFVPSDDVTRTVWLYMHSREAKEQSAADFTLFWSQALGTKGIDESELNPDLATFLWSEYLVAFRKITHFSGYNVHDGYHCPTELNWEGMCPVEPERGTGLIESLM
jgi:hypothetical protein